MKRHLPWIITGVFALWFLHAPGAEAWRVQIEQLAELPWWRAPPAAGFRGAQFLVQIRDRYTVRTPMSSELARPLAGRHLARDHESHPLGRGMAGRGDDASFRRR